MLSAEKKCRKLYTKHYEFSLPIKWWMDRCRAYRALIRLNKKFLEGKYRKPWAVNMNMSNVYRAAESCGIKEPCNWLSYTRCTASAGSMPRT